MARLIYAVNMSLDGYIADRDGNFDWGEPSLAVHQFFNDLLRSVGTHLYGRRMYETMTYWETAPTDASPVHDDFARSGVTPTRSSIRRRSKAYRARARASSVTSTSRPCAR